MPRTVGFADRKGDLGIAKVHSISCHSGLSGVVRAWKRHSIVPFLEQIRQCRLTEDGFLSSMFCKRLHNNLRGCKRLLKMCILREGDKSPRVGESGVMHLPVRGLKGKSDGLVYTNRPSRRDHFIARPI